ncbi:MAG: shikimate kinase [Clostridia bacterium]|nr:shikimate kinase [Clostridia bacterium]
MKNIILIGMPGAGKSTVGVLIAKTLLMDFSDTDLIIQRECACALCDIINEKGTEYFIALEEDIILKQEFTHTVIATGGSAVYGERAMKKLKENGICVYLKVELNELTKRLGDITTRGIAMDKDTGIPELFMERSPLYEKYSDITVDCTKLSPEECVSLIASKLKTE